MPDDGSAETAWGHILDAAQEGRFVPVLGFDVAASTDYADARPYDLESCATGPSAQSTAEDLVRAQLEAIEDALKRDEDHGTMALKYVRKLRSQWKTSKQRDGCAEPDRQAAANSMELVDLQAALVTMAAELTRQWADLLGREPRPLGTTWSDFTASYDETQGFFYDCFRSCLNSSLTLYRARALTGSLRAIDLKWIYVKLLILTSHVLGDSKSFWRPEDDDDFAERHMRLIDDLGEDCGWDISRIDIPVYSPSPATAAHSDEIGIRLSHLVWLEDLLRFTLFSQTRAYRARADIAFALSLRDGETGIPRMHDDPFEIGLLYRRAQLTESEGEEGVLSELVKYATVDDKGGERSAGAFHRSLALLMRHFDATSPRSAVAMVLGFDLEMEHAIEEAEFASYRVLLPVRLPLDERKKREVDASGDDDKSKASEELAQNTWLLGNFTRQDSRYEVTWRTLDGPFSIRDGGPIVIKLFGSPGHTLPPLSEVEGATQNFEATDRPSHRLVLDEMEIIDAILRTDFCLLQGLQQQLQNSMFFCFGRDALSWGDRVAYLVVDAIRTRGREGGDTPIAKQDDGPQVWGAAPRQGESPSEPRSLPSMVATSRYRNKSVEGVWRKLAVTRCDGTTGKKSITSRIVGEVAKL